jgi:DNA primase
LGTAITPEQVKLMSRYADEIIICYDSDEAGQKAALKASALFSQAGVSSKVVVMEEEKDPDEYIKKFGPTRFGMLLNNSENILDYKLNNLKHKFDITTQEGKVKYLSEAVSVLLEVRDSIERDIYLSKLAEDTGVSKELLWSRLNELSAKKRAGDEKREWRKIQSGQANLGAPIDRAESRQAVNPKLTRAQEGVIDFLFKNPDYINYILYQLFLYIVCLV